MIKVKFESLAGSHKKSVATFDCGTPVLNEYLKRYAGQNHRSGVAACTLMLAADTPHPVLGFYTLSSGQVEKDGLPDDVTKRLPNYPVPAVVMGRLAIDRRWQGKGLGKVLMGHAFRKIVEARQKSGLGIVVIVVDAKDEAAEAFYAGFGFTTFVEQNTWPRRMVIPLATVSRAVDALGE
jgi:predicted N-acetyltransferase YhbS